MASYTHDCPYCAAKNSTFTVAGEHKHLAKAHAWSVLLICGACGNGAVAEVSDNGNRTPPLKHPHDLTLRDQHGGVFTVLGLYPRVQLPSIPEHLPDTVAKAFREGCDVLSVSPDAAKGMFRKSLELGLKDLSPDVDAWKLEKRIEKMAALGLLTADLKDWAHELRLDGNDAMHDSGVTTKEDAIQTRELTRYVLMYLYSLPESVKSMRNKKDK